MNDDTLLNGNLAPPPPRQFPKLNQKRKIDVTLIRRYTSLQTRSKTDYRYAGLRTRRSRQRQRQLTVLLVQRLLFLPWSVENSTMHIMCSMLSLLRSHVTLYCLFMDGPPQTPPQTAPPVSTTLTLSTVSLRQVKGHHGERGELSLSTSK